MIGVSFCGDENVLKLIVDMDAHLCDCKKNIELYIKCVICMVYELHLKLLKHFKAYA